MIKIVLFATLLISLAQMFPSCGGDEGGVVIGWVEAKRRDPAFDVFELVINGAAYEVPAYFWDQVKVGDLVKWDGKVWTIVKKAARTPVQGLTIRPV